MKKTKTVIIGLVANIVFGYILTKIVLNVYLLFFLMFIISLIVTAFYFVPLILLNIKVYRNIRVTKAKYIHGGCLTDNCGWNTRY
ncbi:hypothetical protein [Bacillus alkalicellulosilyticus]|uniref:hypothetical protein n=1 Tax=Alkalihalobacterium alkalicellulosilyticum TaxID=1912214 RepID=UPI0009988D87|nr:hypothetical protein [Bacillus alkalicellulosilyticus]